MAPMSVFQCKAAQSSWEGKDKSCRLMFPVSSCVPLLGAFSLDWFAAFPLSFSSPLCSGLSSGWVIQKWSARCPHFLLMVHVGIGLPFPQAVASVATIEIEEVWHFRSLFQKAMAMVVWSRILIRRRENVKALYLAWSSPVIAVCMLILSMMFCMVHKCAWYKCYKVICSGVDMGDVVCKRFSINLVHI